MQVDIESDKTIDMETYRLFYYLTLLRNLRDIGRSSCTYDREGEKTSVAAS